MTKYKRYDYLMSYQDHFISDYQTWTSDKLMTSLWANPEDVQISSLQFLATTNSTSTSTANLSQRHISDVYLIEAGHISRVKLPDGAILEVQKDGSYQLNDKDAKVVYKACRMREFNRYVNASDLLEEFIRFCGQHSLTENEILHLPLQLFIHWLVLEAARADGEEAPEVQTMVIADMTRAHRPRCRFCKRFISRQRSARQLDFCNSNCFDRELQKAA